LARYDDILYTEDNQFGYKVGLGTDMCIFTFKEIVSYYHSLSTNVYACFIDASKAFDRVNHWHLFSKLLERGVPKLVVRLLAVWYVNQKFSIRWCNHVSTPFTVSNGVRQGGILSPRLFTVFVDELSKRLNSSRYGCQILNKSFNHLQYADDAVIIAPTPSSLQRLVSICEQFAKDYDMIFNTKKTFCMCIKYRANMIVKCPSIHLNGKLLSWITDHKYLGVFINEFLKDDNDIKRQRKYIYGKGNMLIRKFGECSPSVKAQLFQSYCTNLYCIALWNHYHTSIFKQVVVSYNNVFRHLLHVRGKHSISSLFVHNKVDTFKMLQRKCIYSFMNRVSKSDNILVKGIFNSSYFLYRSNLFTKWKELLFT
jgi:hypothetical protein